MYKTPQGIYQSKIFDDPGLIHGFSTKRLGDMQNKNDRKKFLAALEIDESSLVQEQQVHGDSIHVVHLEDRRKTINGVDGLVYKKESNTSPITLSVHTADCVPLLFFDPVANIIASAHAGWKGTTLHIGKKVIGEMEKLGVHPGDIRVVIGPRICGTCYDVTKARADMFKKEFPGGNVVSERYGKLYVDIGKANYQDLLVAGVTPKHIDYDSSLCTYCRTGEFHSFRQEGNKLKGEIMGIISLKNMTEEG